MDGLSHPAQRTPANQAAERWLAPLRQIARVSVAYIPAGEESPSGHGAPAFCRMISAQGDSACRKFHRELRRSATPQNPCRAVCPHGLILFAIPARAGGGVFEGGRVFTKRSDASGQKPRLWLDSWRQIPVVREEELGAVIELTGRIADAFQPPEAAAVTEAFPPLPPQIERVREYIESHLADPLSVPVVARVAALSEDYFSKLFKRSMGIGFTEYLTRVRLQWARRLLTGSTKRISEVAYECGFESVPNFNRRFKRATGFAPGVYRQEFRRGATSSIRILA